MVTEGDETTGEVVPLSPVVLGDLTRSVLRLGLTAEGDLEEVDASAVPFTELLPAEMALEEELAGFLLAAGEAGELSPFAEGRTMAPSISLGSAAFFVLVTLGLLGEAGLRSEDVEDDAVEEAVAALGGGGGFAKRSMT